MYTIQCLHIIYICICIFKVVLETQKVVNFCFTTWLFRGSMQAQPWCFKNFQSGDDTYNIISTDTHVMERRNKSKTWNLPLSSNWTVSQLLQPINRLLSKGSQTMSAFFLDEQRASGPISKWVSDPSYSYGLLSKQGLNSGPLQESWQWIIHLWVQWFSQLETSQGANPILSGMF